MLYGEAGADTYVFGRGFGQDTVIDEDATVSNTDTLRFNEGVVPADVRESRRKRDGECANKEWRMAA